MVLVHGLGGSPLEFRELVAQFESSHHVYLFCYDSMGKRTSENGRLLAAALISLNDERNRLGTGDELVIVAHSMGGLVARHALNELALQPDVLPAIGKVRLIAVDTPWHGFFGPSDRNGSKSALMKLIGLPNGFDQMRAESVLFIGDKKSSDPALRDGLYNLNLPDQFSIEMVFAARGRLARSYEEANLRALPDALVAHFTTETPVRGNAQFMNFWRALLSSANYAQFSDELRTLAEENHLNGKSVTDALHRYYPILSGDHESILRSKESGPTLSTYLDQTLPTTTTTYASAFLRTNAWSRP